VGDHPQALDGYKSMLEGDFAVETAAGGKQALAIMQMFGPFAVVLAEMRMSGMNGVEFLSRFREAAPDTAGILLTGSRDHGHAVRAAKLGTIFHYLVKPCEKNELVIAAHLGLAQHRINRSAAELIKEADANRMSAASCSLEEKLADDE
jgi:DNA-binding NtrC family response regulator